MPRRTHPNVGPGGQAPGCGLPAPGCRASRLRAPRSGCALRGPAARSAVRLRDQRAYRRVPCNSCAPGVPESRPSGPGGADLRAGGAGMTGRAPVRTLGAHRWADRGGGGGGDRHRRWDASCHDRPPWATRWAPDRAAAGRRISWVHEHRPEPGEPQARAGRRRAVRGARAIEKDPRRAAAFRFIADNERRHAADLGGSSARAGRHRAARPAAAGCASGSSSWSARLMGTRAVAELVKSLEGDEEAVVRRPGGASGHRGHRRRRARACRDLEAPRR